MCLQNTIKLVSEDTESLGTNVIKKTFYMVHLTVLGHLLLLNTGKIRPS